MDPLDKAVLASLYSSALDPSVPAYDRLKARLPLGQELYNGRVSHLVKMGLIENSDPSKLTFIGRDALKVVLVGGVFDLIHPGHIHTLKAAMEEIDVFILVFASHLIARMINKYRLIFSYVCFL